MAKRLQFEVQAAGARAVATVDIACVVIAGWTGRDAVNVEAHIRELEEIGVARPKSVPMFYRVSADLLTSEPALQVAGREASGEVEAVLIKHAGELLVGVGSDHTDRKLEAYGITLSKQVCGKPVSVVVWPWAEVAGHWDRVVLRSRLADGETYQEGQAAALRRPDELFSTYETRNGPLPDGSLMFCGTLPAHGGVRFSESMDLELHDPVLGRTIHHTYSVDVLPIAEA